MTTTMDEWEALQRFSSQTISIKLKPEQAAVTIYFKNRTVREFSIVEWACIIGLAMFSLSTLALAFKPNTAPSKGLELPLAIAVWLALGGFIWLIVPPRLFLQWFRDGAPSIISVTATDIALLRPRFIDWRRRPHVFPIEQFTGTRAKEWPRGPNDGSSCLYAALYLHFGPYGIQVACHESPQVIAELEYVFNLACRVAPVIFSQAPVAPPVRDPSGDPVPTKRDEGL